MSREVDISVLFGPCPRNVFHAIEDALVQAVADWAEAEKAESEPLIVVVKKMRSPAEAGRCY